MDNQILFFFSALGVFNGLLLAFYFMFFAKPKHLSNTFLGLLFLVLSVRVGKSVFFFFNPELAGIFIQIGITACFFIGPFVYFYFKSMLRPNSKIGWEWKVHLMILLPAILIVGFVYPYVPNRGLWHAYFMNMIFVEWFVYLLAAGLLAAPVFKKLFDKNQKLRNIEIWLCSIYFGNVLIWISYLTSNYTSYITGAISFSVLIYLLILLLVFAKRKDSVLFKNSLKYFGRKMEGSEANALLEKLNGLMLEKRLYKNPNLKLADVAGQVQITAHQLSQLLNDNLGKSFPNWVNEYRISEARKLIQSQDKYSLEGVGYECGFNSKSTFYAAFKLHSGMTPSKFKEAI